MDSIVLGIDFGTTNSCVSFYKKGECVIVIPNNEGKFTTPTTLFLNDDSNEILFGDNVKSLSNIFTTNIFTNLKRLIGKNYDDFKKDLELQNFFKNNNFDRNFNFKVQYNNEQKIFSVSDLISIYINYLVRYSLNFLNIKRTDEKIQVVITIPAYYNDHQREIIKNCCENINLEVLRIINEPTAAALAYAYDNSKNKENAKETEETEDAEFVLVIDSGGGTTDLSLVYLDYTEQLYEVKNVIGDNFLGGEDVTQLLMDYVMNKIKDVDFSPRMLNKIRNKCEIAKKELTYNDNVTIHLEFEKDYIIQISKYQFLEIARPFFNKIKKLILNLVGNSVSEHILTTLSNIKSIIFVGGSTRIPYFKTICKEIFGNDTIINDTVDPDQIISIGAAIQGALLNNLMEDDNFGESLFIDIVPLSIGIEIQNGINVPIISRNTPIPVTRTREFTNSDNNETEIEISIYQGERKFVKDNMFLASFTLSGLPKNCEKGSLVILVTFEIDSDSILTASAKIKSKKGIEYNCEEKIIVTKKCNSLSNVTNLTQILLDAEEFKLADSEMANKIVLKYEFYDTFKLLLGIFHEKRTIIIEKEGENSFVMMKLNEIFNTAFNTIRNFEDYTPEQLKKAKEEFEGDYHSILFDTGSMIEM
jgi:molecular chaperone DnaK (HSP70)